MGRCFGAMPGVVNGMFRKLTFWCAAVLAVLAAAGCGPREPAEPLRVVIASQPESGAAVTVDGVAYGETPVTLEGRAGKEVFIVASKEGYRDAKEIYQVPESGEHRVVLEMEPRLGYITLESDPPEAVVYMDDDVLLGRTPMKLQPVPVGKRTLEFRLSHYEPSVYEQTIEEDFEYTLKADLAPQPAEVTIFSRPSSADIFVNGVLQEETTPAKFNLKPGDYTIGVYTKGYVTKEEVVTLLPDEKKQLDLTMVAGQVPRGMVLIPAGEIIFGTDNGPPDERPQRKIFVDAFYMDKYEVTNGDFAKVFPDHRYDEGLEQFPVTGVTWRKAVEYAQAVGKRLPTEIEWEKAARGEDGRQFPWGEVFREEYANTGETFGAHLMRVGEFLPGASPYGCMDMAGNAMEWVSDWYQAYPGNTEIAAEYGQVFRVLRGGSYLSKRYDVRCASRDFDKVESIEPDYGFRCAKDIVLPEESAN